MLHIQVVNKVIIKIQSVSTAFISVSERLIEFNHVYYVSELSANLISAELMKYQGYIYCDLQVDAENYFEFLSSINSDIFYTNLSHNNIYILSDSSPTFHGVMNDSMYEAVAYVAVPKLKTISTDYNSNAGSLRPFSCEEIEQLINSKNSDTDFFVISSSSQLSAVLSKQLLIDE
ncbi:uncharacterized protein BDCG_17406 [Blastomyces dermatitidis ER-3]|uniref:Uncharacterized protein n=1 Tax=Ajellomyces dermatitidis (strain ER-3 / ATCC MYA-2586) TaxID=559297 RepID=A0ABX2VYJ0_AJEDR|nr:uncharacterized protein BDCG_17406 [Blastomyces dermatitidis ER-3]OAT02146.1 hypothetical protein BDCG_17406 [Blastomyces dermatitidis ER-3]